MLTGIKSLAVLGVVVAMVAVSVGCQQRTSPQYVRNNLSPEMFSTTQHKQQYRNMEAIAHHRNFRQIPDDWSRFWLSDRPSRMTPLPRTH